MVKQPVQNSLLLVAFLLLSAFPAIAQNSPQELVSQVKRAVVIITTYDNQKKPLQQGSGFFISSNRIVTNLYVIESAHEIRIRTFTGETVSVSNVAAEDRKANFAILRIATPCRETTSLKVANISPAERKRHVVLRDTRGSRWKVTIGRVAGSWNLEDLRSRMQVTLSLVPGSNGPIVNLKAHVVGTGVMDRGTFF